MSKKITAILPPAQIKVESLEENSFCKDFLEALKSTDHLDILCLSGNSYSATFFAQLAPYLAKMSRISCVIAADIFTTRKDEHILPALAALNESLKNKGVVLFDLSSNAICPDGCEKIVDIIRTNPSMRHLILNHVALSEKGTVTISKAVEEGGLSLTTLKVIKNRIEREAPRFAEMLQKMANLEELVIFQNSIKNEFMTPFLQALLKLKKLVVLDIGDNHINDEQAGILAEIIRGSEHLRVLKIDDCNISSAGSKLIFDALADAPVKLLEEFSYNYNEFASVEGLLEALRDYPHLKKLGCKGADDCDYETKRAGLEVENESEDEDLEDGAEEPQAEDYGVAMVREFEARYPDDDFQCVLPGEKSQLQEVMDQIKDLKLT